MANKQYRRGVKIRARPTGPKRPGGRRSAFEISVPREVVDLVPPGSRFHVEVVEEGILFRLIREQPKARPTWTNPPG